MRTIILAIYRVAWTIVTALLGLPGQWLKKKMRKYFGEAPMFRPSPPEHDRRPRR